MATKGPLKTTQGAVGRLVSKGWTEQPAENVTVPTPLKTKQEEGGYKILHQVKKGTTVVTIEQNVANEDLGGFTAQVTYPEVAVIEVGALRVACNAKDPDLIESVVAELEAANHG